MNFWRRIFRFNQEAAKMNSHFDKYRKELKRSNLTTFEDLEKLVLPLLKNATKLSVNKPLRPPENSQLQSHFGGQPYFEKSEEWPKTKKGTNLDFVFQVFNNDALSLPKNIRLIQFFYCWEESPWDTENDGWLVKIYETLDTSRVAKIDKPMKSKKTKYCEITFKPVKSLPDWEGIDSYNLNASKLSCVLDENEPWSSYQKVIEKLIGEQNYQSQLGGYPKWVQGESIPKNSNGEKMKFLCQIDSEDNAGIMWGDAGLIYIFYDEETKRTAFKLQCH